MIILIQKENLERQNDKYFKMTHVYRHRWRGKSPVKIKESSCYFFHFYRTLSAPAISTDMSQVGVALYPSF